MLLPIPGVGTEAGPQFAFDINNALNLIDAHDHSSGRGVQVTPSGLNINATLNFQNQLISSPQAIIFQNQSSLATVNALYTIAGELWYNDPTNPVQITSAGTVNATSSSLTSGTASAAFSAGVLVVNSVTSNSTPANIQFGSALLGNNTAGSNFLTLQPPSLTGGGYTLTLPTIPATTKFLTIDNTGVISTASSISGSQLATGTLTGSQMANQTVTATQIANATITTTQISATAGILPSQLGAVQAGGGNSSIANYSNSTGTYTAIGHATVNNLLAFTVVNGRPIVVNVTGNRLGQSAGNEGYIELSSDGAGGAGAIEFIIQCVKTSGFVDYFVFRVFDTGAGGTWKWPVHILSLIDVANSTDASNNQIVYTYSAKINSAPGGTTATVSASQVLFFGFQM